MLPPSAGRSVRRRRRTGRFQRTSTRFSCLEVDSVLAEGVANQKDTAASARGKGSLRIGFGNRREAVIEPLQLGACGRAASLRKGNEGRVELRLQAKLGAGSAKLDDRGADRQRGPGL